jgi:hypothetical protein
MRFFKTILGFFSVAYHSCDVAGMPSYSMLKDKAQQFDICCFKYHREAYQCAVTRGLPQCVRHQMLTKAAAAEQIQTRT